MEELVYERMAANEAEHWWFAGRRRILDRLVAKALRRPGGRLLEVGCGSGGNLQLLAAHGRLDAVEFDPSARAVARARTGVDVQPGGLPDDLDVDAGAYDLIALFDVLEHIGDDVASLRFLATRLAPGGAIVVTVPAYQWLWSRHDVVHHHKRRYTRTSLEAAILGAGLQVRKSGYFNTLLFPVAVARRVIARLTGSEKPDDEMPGPLLNSALKSVFSSEALLVPGLTLPFGLSVFAIAEAGPGRSTS